MKPAAKALALVAASLICSACFNVGLVVTVRPDGTGTIDETVMMTAQAVQQLAALAAMGGEDASKAGVKPNEMFTEPEIRKRAEQLGVGVRLESVDPIRSAEGEGYKARYAFDDVTKLSLSQMPDPPVSGMSSGPSNAGKMVLRFDRGATGSLLTLRMPEPEADDKPEAAGESMIPGDMPPEAMMMAQQMFKGARMSVVLALDGRITRTNAPAELVNGSRITIAEVDFERLLADPTAMQKLRNLRSIAEARKIGAEMPGLRMFLEPELVVQFGGR